MLGRLVPVAASLALFFAAEAGAVPRPLPIGRAADPAGHITPLQAYPTGVAVSPDGNTLLAIAGPQIQGGATPNVPGPLPSASPGVAVMVIDARTGAMRQTLRLDDGFQDIVFSRDSTHAYVAGGSHRTVYELEVPRSGGAVTLARTLSLGGFVSALALARDGRTMWVAEPEAGQVQRLDLVSGQVTRTMLAPSPNQLALSRDNHWLYATNWRGRAVTRLDTRSGARRVLATGLHPTDVAVTRDGRLVVADANDASLATFPNHSSCATYTNLAQLSRRNDSPNALVLGRDGRAYVSLGGDDAVAVLTPSRRPGSARPPRAGVALPRSRLVAPYPVPGAAPASASAARAVRRVPRGGCPRRVRVPRRSRALRGFRLSGLISTGWYPDALALSPDGSRLHVVTARGLARSAGATEPYVDPDPIAPVVDSAYGTIGTLETLTLPDRRGLAALTRRTRDTLAARYPTQPKPNPILAGPRGPLRHVIYITRENKTYDSILGDLHPGRPGNALVLFGRDVTPNIHALQTQFAESDNFSYEGFASVVGHMWEDAGAVSDVFERAVGSNTGAHTAHGNESWKEQSNYPPTGLVTQQAWRAGRSVRTYNQELAQLGRLLPERLQAPQSVFPNFDLAKPDVGRVKGWESEFRQFASHRCTGALVAGYRRRCSLPALEYVYLGEDHTTIVDEPGYPTIQAQVADNDYATARIIDAVSHSPYWKSTAVIVVEDDPQGTGDSKSSYHGLLGIASPYVKRGTISHTPYSLTSAVSAIDHVLGLPEATDFALTSRPLDDLFTATPDLRPFSADPSGVQRYPFVALPGLRASSDRKHGISSFTEPDKTDPRVSTRAQWRAVKHTAPRGP